jgi:hypothetical protein
MGLLDYYRQTRRKRAAPEESGETFGDELSRGFSLKILSQFG